jgi:predicted neutral ceramidase superfamily lipid hydrolase
MKKPHIVNLVYSLILMAAGMTGFILRYLEVRDFQFTALIPFIFGILLLALTRGISRQNKIISHLAVVLTLIIAAMTAVMFIKNSAEGFKLTRKGIIFILIIFSSFTVLTLYIIRFIRIRKSLEKEQP